MYLSCICHSLASVWILWTLRYVFLNPTVDSLHTLNASLSRGYRWDLSVSVTEYQSAMFNVILKMLLYLELLSKLNVQMGFSLFSV